MELKHVLGSEKKRMKLDGLIEKLNKNKMEKHNSVKVENKINEEIEYERLVIDKSKSHKEKK